MFLNRYRDEVRNELYSRLGRSRTSSKERRALAAAVEVESGADPSMERARSDGSATSSAAAALAGNLAEKGGILRGDSSIFPDQIPETAEQELDKLNDTALENLWSWCAHI